MINIKLRPYSSSNDEGIYVKDYPYPNLEIAASGVDAMTCLEHLVNAINADEVDDVNNELIIVEEHD